MNFGMTPVKKQRTDAHRAGKESWNESAGSWNVAWAPKTLTPSGHSYRAYPNLNGVPAIEPNTIVLWDHKYNATTRAPSVFARVGNRPIPALVSPAGQGDAHFTYSLAGVAQENCRKNNILTSQRIGKTGYKVPRNALANQRTSIHPGEFVTVRPPTEEEVARHKSDELVANSYRPFEATEERSGRILADNSASPLGTMRLLSQLAGCVNARVQREMVLGKSTMYTRVVENGIGQVMLGCS